MRLRTALILSLGLVAAVFTPVLTLLVSLVLAMRGLTRERPWRWATIAAFSLVMLFVSPVGPLSADGVNFIRIG